MQLTAAVINAGLGSLSYGLEMVGFKVVAAYESEEQAITIHRANIDAPVYPLSLENIDVKQFPKVDLLAANIYQPLLSRASHFEKPPTFSSVHKLRTLLEYCSPRAFFLLCNISSAKSRDFQQFLTITLGEAYQLTWEVIDVSQMTGFPVKEHIACVVGISPTTGKHFEFPKSSNPPRISLKSFLQLNQSSDSWYYRVKFDHIAESQSDSPILCWKKQSYVGTELIQWNYMKVPLVWDVNTFRKITPQEIANFKGFPTVYAIPDKNRQWLYKKLIYEGNVLVIKQIAGMISYTLASNPWRSQQKERGVRFERLFSSYLTRLKNKALDIPITIKQVSNVSGHKIDFVANLGSETFYFEVKYTPTTKVKAVCEQISPLKESGTPILVIASEVSDGLKKQCLEQFGVSIWDVENLLWLFDEFPDIKNEFIASLDYAIDHIEPKPPAPAITQEIPEQKCIEPDLKERLLQIPPGREHFRNYELTCTEILKYVLGDYLTLWESQEHSNNGLYRFDLCCKIKNGANQDFFDTIKQHFNTKYIVFEFKNYKEKISQKEIYTTEKYLYEKALRKVAIIISRSGADDHALQAARGTLRENGKLILCLSDNSLLELIDIKTRGEQEPSEFLDAILDDFLVHLEK